ncbi:MAG: DUF255 domain-containing protein [Deltaproteobacteria bacterium]|nr:DUF255 domain-containing protein [Deltaproteobacteria bacterium]
MKLTKVRFIILIFFVASLGMLHNTAFSKEIDWQSYADGMARSKFEKKKVFLHFYAEWCAACKVMEEKTFKDPGVIASLNENFISIKVDVDREKQTSEMFKVKLLPDTWFLETNNKIIGRRPGYISPQQLKVILQMLMDEDTGQ